MQRIHRLKSSVWIPQLKKRASNSWSAVQDTYYSTKDTFERHRVVFTIGSSVASVATALIGCHRVAAAGYFVQVLFGAYGGCCIPDCDFLTSTSYSLRHFHETRVSRRLDSIEAAMNNNYQFEREEIKKIVHTGSLSTEACIATAGTTLIVGYALGWRGGKWYANRKFRREQMKLLGQTKPRRWKLQFIKRPSFQFTRLPLIRNKLSKGAVTNSEALPKEGSPSTLVKQ